MTFPENIEKKKDKNLFPLSLQQVSNESQCLVREKKNKLSSYSVEDHYLKRLTGYKQYTCISCS